MNLFKRCSCEDRSCKHAWWYMFRLRGRLHRGSTKASNKEAAKRLAGRAYTDALDGNTQKAHRTLLKDAVKQYLTHMKDMATLNKTDRVLNEFVDFVGERRLVDVSAFLIEKWKLERSKEIGQSTVNRELNVVKGFFTWCVAMKLAPATPAAAVKKYRVDDVRIRVLSPAEIQAVLVDAPTDIALLCRATLECLARLSELLTLKRQHIGSSWIEVRRKGGRVQRLPVTAELRTALLARVHGNGYVFAQSDEGEPPTQQAATNMIARHMASRGVADASHHTCRHTGVTLMLEAGVNPRVIQQLAGWTTLRMLERYGHVRDSETQRAVTVTADAVKTALATDHKSDHTAEAQSS